MRTLKWLNNQNGITYKNYRKMCISAMFFSKIQGPRYSNTSCYLLNGNAVYTIIVVITGIYRGRGDLDCSLCITISFLKTVYFSSLPLKTKIKNAQVIKHFRSILGQL